MPCFSIKKKSSKPKERSNESKSSTITQNGEGTITTSVTTTTYKNVSSTSSSEVVIIKSSSNTKSDSTDFELRPMFKMATDAKPFDTTRRSYQSQPYRSAFSSSYQPLTTRQNNVALVNGGINRPAPRPVDVGLVLPKGQNDDLNRKLQIVVKKSLKFHDDNVDTKVPMYKTRSKNRGRLLLINNIKFINNKHERAGAELDEANVKRLFEEIGFTVIKYRNLTKKELEEKIKSFRDDSSLKKVDIGCVVVMSHGTGHERSDSTQVLCSDGQLVETASIINEFNNVLCNHLSGKPKIFIFQCCRGNAQDVQYDGVPLPTDTRILSDTLLAYSTVPGYVSHRDPKNGTVYIQAICKVFMEHAHDTHVEDLLKIVDDELSTYVTAGLRQTTSFENRGFKNCYLHPKLSE